MYKKDALMFIFFLCLLICLLSDGIGEAFLGIFESSSYLISNIESDDYILPGVYFEDFFLQQCICNKVFY